jgi:CheY-like chemotaxis protein
LRKKDCGVSEERNHEHVVLVVDDVRSARIVAARILGAHGYEVIPAASWQAALHVLAGTEGISVVVADWHLQGGDGLTLLKLVGKWYPEMGRVLWTGWGCDVARELGIPCVDKGAPGRALLDALRLVTGEQTPVAP